MTDQGYVSPYCFGSAPTTYSVKYTPSVKSAKTALKDAKKAERKRRSIERSQAKVAGERKANRKLGVKTLRRKYSADARVEAARLLIWEEQGNG